MRLRPRHCFRIERRTWPELPARLTSRVLCALGIGCAALAACPSPGPPPPEEAVAQSAQTQPFHDPDADGWGSAGDLRYLELITKGADRSQSLPWIVLIHGMGDAPSPEWLQLVDSGVAARVIMPQAPYPHGPGYSWFTYNVDGENPPDQLARGITSALQRIVQLITIIPSHRRCEGRPIVMGFSQGGMLSYALAVHAADRVRFALPIAGLLPEPLWPNQPPPPSSPPIRALHGTADTLVPIASARALTARLTQLGYDARLEELADLGHSISPDVQARVQALLRPELRH